MDTNKNTRNNKLLQKQKFIIKNIRKQLQSLDDKPRNYLKDSINLINSKIGIEYLNALILFGSQNIGDTSQISDCDILIITRNSISDKTLKDLKRYFSSLEIKHGYKEQIRGFIDRIMRAFQTTTGIFVSHFITNLKSWKQKKFSKIFSVNKIFSFLFAPRKLVLQNVIASSKFLYKSNGIDKKSENRFSHPKSIEIIKSLMLNLILAMGSVSICPFAKDSIQYLLESIKWSLRAFNYYIFADSAQLTTIIDRFKYLEDSYRKKRKSEQFLHSFIRLRENPQIHFKFILKTLFMIIKIHSKPLNIEKLRKG
jgi:predicted nucleotidyltransferase